MIPRLIRKQLMERLAASPAVALIGPRQCGKSTMLMKIFEGLENTAMVSFEDRTALTLFDRNIDDFVDVYVKNKKFLFIDEFQYAKNGGKKLKYIFRALFVNRLTMPFIIFLGQALRSIFFEVSDRLYWCAYKYRIRRAFRDWLSSPSQVGTVSN